MTKMGRPYGRERSDVGTWLALHAARLAPYRVKTRLARLSILGPLWARALRSAGEDVVTVAGGPLAGIRFTIDFAQEKAFWLATHEPAVQRFIAEAELSRDDEAWDVGAHIGFFSLLLAKRCRRVIAVEPDPTNAARLRANVELNHARVEILQAAVWSIPGLARLELGPESGTHRLLGSSGVRWLSSGAGMIENVRATTLDEMLDHFGPPALVKIDIEGGEVDAISGANHLLGVHPTLVCEVHSDEAQRALLATLQKYGYTCTQSGSHLFAM
jgi:FkbM family methyltransferase